MDEILVFYKLGEYGQNDEKWWFKCLSMNRMGIKWDMSIGYEWGYD